MCNVDTRGLWIGVFVLIGLVLVYAIAIRAFALLNRNDDVSVAEGLLVLLVGVSVTIVAVVGVVSAIWRGPR